MERITTLLQKIKDISSKAGDFSVIEVDLMMDYTKVLYADLLEMRNRVYFNGSVSDEQPTPITETMPTPDAVLPVASASDPEIIDEQKDAETFAQPSLNVATDTETTEDIPAIAELSMAPEKHPFVNPKTSPTGQDIRRYIAINDKFLFINELFNGDANAYEAVLNELNNHANYLNAVSWLDETHSMYHWDDEHPTVVSFYAVVSHFFASM